MKKRRKKQGFIFLVDLLNTRSGYESYETWNRRQKTDVTSDELSPVITITQAADYTLEEINMDIGCKHTEQLKGAAEPKITLEDLYNGF